MTGNSIQQTSIIIREQQQRQLAGLDTNDGDLVTRAMAGLPVSSRDPEFARLMAIVSESQQIMTELNTGYHSSETARRLFFRLTGTEEADGFLVFPPFYTDFGKNIRVGKNVFINQGCTFMDRGGITLGDGTLVGPGVKLITINHAWNPAMRHVEICSPVAIGKNVWIGAGATILPDVTVGDGAIISAAAVVTRDVPPNAVAAGIPARVVKTIET